jgi:hypothetical protein
LIRTDAIQYEVEKPSGGRKSAGRRRRRCGLADRGAVDGVEVLAYCRCCGGPAPGVRQTT